jgi:type IV secretory pathway VirB3-like protein
MTEQMIKETETHKIRQNSNVAQRIIYTISSVILAVLAFRFIFRLFGANPDNGFVRVVYALTKPFVGIFEGIFSTATINGAETTVVFEPATLIAMVVIALVFWVVLKLITPSRGNRFESTEYTKYDKSETTDQ